MKMNEIYSGFQLIHEEYIEGIRGTARMFRHLRTKAPLLYISNDDSNKVFQIAFRTPSKNSTGVAHIIEHSVLCGSRKYPVKEPFVELVKGSLNTFLNAMTYPDKTVYPIASTNDKDFMNLMDVYLDAVFYPDIEKKPEIFKQEGWHYHLEDVKDDLTYNGVVYNEMKGAYSNPEEILSKELFQTLFPDNIYGEESGGFPPNIPDLTYEAFLDFHRKFYHPSNSYIYLYGDGDVLAHLEYLDHNYLSHFDYREVDSHIDNQPAFDAMRESEVDYPISGEEDLSDKDYLALGYVLGHDLRYNDLMAFDIMIHILLSANSSPLKKALLDLNICKEVDYSFSSSLKQPYFTIVLKNTDKKYKDLFRKTVVDSLEKLVKTGLNPKDVEAGINHTEFILKEEDFGTYPRGLMYGLEMMDTWLYDGNPLDHLKYSSAIQSIRDASSNRGFEALIERYLIQNTHCALVSASPDPSLAEKNDASLKDKLKRHKDSLDAEQLQALVEDTQNLEAYQSSEDSPEALATIPVLSLDEIGKKAKKLDVQEETIDGKKLLWHPLETNGVVHVRLFFDTRTLPQEELKYLALINKLLGQLSTEHLSDEALNQEIEIYTGGIGTSMESYDNVKVIDDYQSKFIVKGKAMGENIDKLMELMGEIILHTRFNEKSLVENVISEERTSKEMSYLTAGHTAAIHRLQSYYSQAACAFQEVGGLDFFRFMADLDDHFDTAFDELAVHMADVCRRLFVKDHLIVSLGCDEDLKDKALKAISHLIDQLNEAGGALNTYRFTPTLKNEGIMTAAEINYVAKGYNYKSLGYEYRGSAFVLKTLLSMDYLWNRIRVKGGAYGASFGVGRTGDLAFSSYRDPKLGETLSAYDHVGDYLRQLDISQRELEKYIIGSISSRDVPLTARLMINVGDSMFFSGLTQDVVQSERDQILSTTVDDLKNHADMIDAAMAENCFCVIGNEEAIHKSEELFNETTYIRK